MACLFELFSPGRNNLTISRGSLLEYSKLYLKHSFSKVAAWIRIVLGQCVAKIWIQTKVLSRPPMPKAHYQKNVMQKHALGIDLIP